MPKFNVAVPICGVVYVTVEANNKLAAESVADERVNTFLQNSTFDEDEDDVCLGELAAYRKIVSGNVFHGPLNQIDVEPIEE